MKDNLFDVKFSTMVTSVFCRYWHEWLKLVMMWPSARNIFKKEKIMTLVKDGKTNYSRSIIVIGMLGFTTMGFCNRREKLGSTPNSIKKSGNS